MLCHAEIKFIAKVGIFMNLCSVWYQILYILKSTSASKPIYIAHYIYFQFGSINDQ